MKIYTKRGDTGETSLVDGRSISKSDIRLKTYGTLDELNSHLGLLISLLKSEAKLEPELAHLNDLQIWLFQLGSQLACADQEMAKKLPTINKQQILSMEQKMDTWDEELPPLKNFILPGGHLASSQAHVCRTIARRAERACVSLHQQQPLEVLALPFLNRMSDYFYSLARLINARLGIASVEWKP
ncbi:MAG: cob(I)yrinic acid a,c-diamide adenosyltransferase [Pseudomonadota bacterium]